MSTVTQRQAWMAILAKTELELLEPLVNKLSNLPNYSFLRSPEIGLTMVRGRAGATGEPFNLGEITMTRCVVQLESQGDETITGFGYMQGQPVGLVANQPMHLAGCLDIIASVKAARFI